MSKDIAVDEYVSGTVVRPWRVLVTEGRQAAKMQWTLGDLAAEVHTGYGDHSLERYAEEIGVNYSTLRSYLSVARAYPESVGRPTFSVGETLVSQPDRAELARQVKTFREARELAVSRRGQPSGEDTPAGGLESHRPLTESGGPEDEPGPAGTMAHVGRNSGDNEWYTPAPYITAATAVMGGIDLDPASSDIANELIRAAHYFTEKDSGLDHTWYGRVWMNPPYAQPLIREFSDKLSGEFRSGNVTEAIVLVNNATETAWFQVLGQEASAFCAPRGRLRFWYPGKESASPLQGQMILYMGISPGKFINEFRQFGLSGEFR
ncbi:MAG TPA: DNA N-6-adenine-methyltransferase [Geobacteraceae bacterium]|nr:DNA N-6-adenine-methyltransferase [Geobacteraceae bacterium]